MKTCCICRGKLTDKFGNNPDGAIWKDTSGNIVFPEFKENDRCCDECNLKFVIPGRMYRLKHCNDSEDGAI